MTDRVLALEPIKLVGTCAICGEPATRKLVTGYRDGDTGQLTGTPYCNRCLIDIHQLISEEIIQTLLGSKE